MMTSKIAFHQRILLRAAMVAALAVAAAIGVFAVRDAVVPAEAKSPTRSGQVSSSGTQLRVRVRFEALGTERAGITGKPRSARIDEVAVGDTFTRFFAAGKANDSNICRGLFWVDPLADYMFLFRIETTVVGVAEGRPTLQVHWTRSRVGEAAPERDETRTITVGSRDTHTFDYIESPDAAGTCASLMLRVSAEPFAPGPTQQLIAELWTVDEIQGATRSVHQQVHGKSGDALDYHLPQLDVVLAGVSAPNGTAIGVDVSGLLQATLDGDGFVNVVLTTTRRSVSAKGSVGGEGRVEFRAKVGEPAEVLLPDPVGHLLLSEGGPRVDLARVFAGHQTSLYVKVTVAQ